VGLGVSPSQLWFLWLAVQAFGWVGHRQQIEGCGDTYRHGSSSWWQYDPRCSSVTVSEMDDALRH